MFTTLEQMKALPCMQDVPTDEEFETLLLAGSVTTTGFNDDLQVETKTRYEFLVERGHRVGLYVFQYVPAWGDREDFCLIKEEYQWNW